MADPKYLSTDPFPSIRPALLNSADIADYVTATGMIDPFDPAKLKSASYEVDFSGEVHSWNKNGKKQVDRIANGRKFKLIKNSIVFVFLSTTFRLPSYIAIRFNLKITHVHRGLLLGTGPLVDPGFEGRLLVPLHNLTSDDYELEGGKGLIWVEFTKLSDNLAWGVQSGNGEADLIPRVGRYKPFPEDKKHLDASNYLFKASPHAPIASSIPFLLDQAEEALRKSNETSKKAEDFLRAFRRQGYQVGGIALLSVVIALIAVFIQVVSLVSDSNNYVISLRKDMDVTERKLDEQRKDQVKYETKLEQLGEELSNLKKSRTGANSNASRPLASPKPLQGKSQ